MGLPRASGGVSQKIEHVDVRARSSPRKRGCFSDLAAAYAGENVFPAQAGSILDSFAALRGASVLSRVCGVLP